MKSKWELAAVGDIASKIESGNRPTGGVAHITSGVLSLGGEHIDNVNGTLNLARPKFVPNSFYKNAERGKLRKYDFLLCKDGALTGKVALVRDELDGQEAIINEHVFLVRCKSVETQKYMFYYFYSAEGQNLLQSRVTGAAQGGLNSTELRNIKIPLPPLDVQKKIVAEIEKIEEKEKATKNKIVKLQEQFTILADTIMAGNYESDQLDNLVEFQNGLWTGKKPPFQMVKVLRNTNFKLNNGKLSYDNIAEIEVETSQLTSRTLEYGDIILEKSGGSETQAIGRVVLFDKEDNDIYSFSNFCARIRVANQDRLHPIFLWFFLNDFYNKGGTVPLQNGVRLLNINFQGYKAVKIPLPPLSEQRKIVAKIEHLEAEITALQTATFSPQKNAVLEKYLAATVR